MSKAENESLKRSNYVAELQEKLKKHLSEDPFHEGGLKDKTSESCSECIYLTRQIENFKKGPTRYYKTQ